MPYLCLDTKKCVCLAKIQVMFQFCADSVFLPLIFTGPVHLKDLIIPNPLKESHLFYNNVLFDLVKASYELMAPEQFRSYVISQRVHRWKLNENFNRIKSQFQDLLRNGKSGNVRNVSKYASEDQGSFLAKDVRRIENTEAVVKGLFDKVSPSKALSPRTVPPCSTRSYKSGLGKQMNFLTMTNL